eukprot:15430906-Alexandrium_andersonii.AAC.1
MCRPRLLYAPEGAVRDVIAEVEDAERAWKGFPCVHPRELWGRADGIPSDRWGGCLLANRGMTPPPPQPPSAKMEVEGSDSGSVPPTDPMVRPAHV